MNNREKHSLIVELFEGAKNIAILPSKMGGTDSFCAGVGLFHILKGDNKKVSLVYPGLLPEGCENICSKEDITTDLKSRELIVSVDYKGTQVEKIQYSTENEVFYLKMSPIDNDFDISKITSNLLGLHFDVFVIIGAKMPQDLGQVFSDIERDYSMGKVINMDITERNTRYGHYNIVDPLKDSMSLLTMHTAFEWDLKITAEAAKAFLLGISKKSTPK